jgi:hypothetical protein
LVGVVVRAPGTTVKSSEDTNDRVGLIVRTPVEHIALLSRRDVFEHEYSTPSLVVDHATEEIRDMAAHEFSAMPAEEQFALDRGRRLLLDDERPRPTTPLGLDVHAVDLPAHAVLGTDPVRIEDSQRAVPPRRSFREDEIQPR